MSTNNIDTIKVMQHNMNGQHSVTEQLRDLATEFGYGIALIQEPSSSLLKLRGLGRGAIRIVSSERESIGNGKGRPYAAITIFDSELEVVALERLSSRYIAAAIVRRMGGSPIVFVSAYFKPAVGVTPLLRELHSLLGLLNLETIIGIDTNAHSSKWHHVTNNGGAMAKGRPIAELIDDLGLCVHNKPSVLITYQREGMGRSNIDVTILTLSLAGSISSWEVRDITDRQGHYLRL